jgi:hypothetical protein
MRVERLVGFNTFILDRWVRGGRTLEFFHEFIESGMDFSNLAIEFSLDVVHFLLAWLECIYLLGIE